MDQGGLPIFLLYIIPLAKGGGVPPFLSVIFWRTIMILRWNRRAILRLKSGYKKKNLEENAKYILTNEGVNKPPTLWDLVIDG